MTDFIEHSGRIGTCIITAAGAKLILDFLGDKNSREIKGRIEETGAEFEIKVNKNQIGDHSGMLDRKRYNPSNRDFSYSMEIFGFTHPALEGRNDFAVAMAIMRTNNVITGANIIKVSDPGYKRNPYRHNIIGTDPDKGLDIYDVKRGGNLGFVEALVNFCLGEFYKVRRDNPPLPSRA